MADWSDGTRFLLYPQFDEGFAPEPVTVAAPAGSIGPGPADARMYVANPRHKASPYAPPASAPPYRGPVHTPAMPDRGGHFDQLSLHSPQFDAAHLFGTVRFALDTWEAAAGEAVRWWHPEAPARLELVPLVHWSNAQSGPGYLETGLWPAPDGTWERFCLNFDVVAHETGHAILFGTMGAPAPERLTAQFFALHEAFADLFAIVAALRFDTVRARLLAQTEGNLYALNLLNRLGETAPHQQIRLASNQTTMADVAGITLSPDGTWHDARGLGRNAHGLAEPLVGAVFDALVEIYQAGLVGAGVIKPLLDPRHWSARATASGMPRLRAEHARARARFGRAFDDALVEAGHACLAGLVAIAGTLPPDEACFDRAAARLLEALALRGWGGLFPALLACFTRRGMDPEPHLDLRPVETPGSRSARRPVRELACVAAAWRGGCDCGEVWHLSAPRRAIGHPHRARFR